MKRKLLALLLSGLTVVLMMGAGADNQVLAADADNSVWMAEYASSTQATVEQIKSEIQQVGQSTLAESVNEGLDSSLQIDGQPVPQAVSKYIEAGVSYVSLAEMAKALDPSVQVSWNENDQIMVIRTENLTITAVKEYSFVEANGRYLFVPNRVQVVNGHVIVPLKVVAKAFAASVSWDETTQTVHVTRGSSAIKSGESFYKEDAVFWLSRVIYAESGGESMKGMVAVGNVVMNRVASKSFPNTIYGVISQKNQFSTFKNGKLAKCTPTERSVIAAKIVLDGGVVEEVKDALFFDAFLNNSWAARNKAVVATIGGHRFYG